MANGTCSICKKQGKIHHHHTNYKKDKTIPVCPTCHARIHAGRITGYTPEDSPIDTMMAVKKWLREKIKAMGTKGETYTTILARELNVEEDADD